MNLLAIEGTKALAESLPVIVENPHDKPAREKAQYGAWLCAMCLGSVGVSLKGRTLMCSPKDFGTLLACPETNV